MEVCYYLQSVERNQIYRKLCISFFISTKLFDGAQLKLRAIKPYLCNYASKTLGALNWSAAISTSLLLGCHENILVDAMSERL